MAGFKDIKKSDQLCFACQTCPRTGLSLRSAYEPAHVLVYLSDLPMN